MTRNELTLELDFYSIRNFNVFLFFYFFLN